MKKSRTVIVIAVLALVPSMNTLPMQTSQKKIGNSNINRQQPSPTRSQASMHAHDEAKGLHNPQQEDWYPQDWIKESVDPMQGSLIGSTKIVDHQISLKSNKSGKSRTDIAKGKQPASDGDHHHHSGPTGAAKTSNYSSKPKTAPDGTPFGVWRSVPPRPKVKQLSRPKEKQQDSMHTNASTSLSSLQPKLTKYERLRADAARVNLQDIQNPNAPYESLYNQLNTGKGRDKEIWKQILSAVASEKAKRRRSMKRFSEEEALPELRGPSKTLPTPKELQYLPVKVQKQWETALRVALRAIQKKEAKSKAPVPTPAAATPSVTITSPLHKKIWPANTKTKEVEPITLAEVQQMSEDSQRAWRRHRGKFPNDEEEIGEWNTPQRGKYLRSHEGLRNKWGFDHFPVPARGKRKVAEIEGYSSQGQEEDKGE